MGDRLVPNEILATGNNYLLIQTADGYQIWDRSLYLERGSRDLPIEEFRFSEIGERAAWLAFVQREPDAGVILDDSLQEDLSVVEPLRRPTVVAPRSTAKHKFARAGLTVVSNMQAPDLLKLAEQVAAETRGVGWELNKKVRLTPVERSSNRVKYSIGQRKPLLTFYIEVEPQDSGGSTLRTRIVWFVTSQSMVGGFIPAGPKKMVGFPFYEQFMMNLEGVMGSRDPEAECSFSESAGADS